MLQERRSRLVESQAMMTTVTPMVTEPAAAARAGADWAARERLGLSLDDVAATLRIRPPHLEALEEGRIALLPGNAYALAFVRTYAGALGLDAEEMVRRFKAEAAAFNHQPELVFPVPMPERGLPAGALVLLGLVLAVGAYTGWYRCPARAACPPKRSLPCRNAWPRWPNRSRWPNQPPWPNAPSVATAGCNVRSGPQIVLTGPAPEPAAPVVAFSPTSAAAAQLPPHSADARAGSRTGPAGRPMRHASCCGPAPIPG